MSENYADAGTEEAEDRLSLVRLADVEPESVTWLWRPYIPSGKITIIEGDPGLGKSWLTLRLATAISTGEAWPTEDPDQQRVPSEVLLLSAEDGLGDTIRPRLDALGADVDRVHARDAPLTFDADGILRLRECIAAVSPALVIIDPIVAYLGSGVDLHRANEVRAVMSRLAAVASQTGCAIVLVRHLTKGAMTKTIYRGIGSIDMLAASRSVLLVGADAADRDRRAVVHVKSNLAPMGDSLGYRIEDGRFEWTGTSTMTAGDIHAAEVSAGGGEDSIDEAIDFLSDALACGSVASATLDTQAKRLGISRSTFNRARKKLGVETKRETDARGRVIGWMMSLPGREVVEAA